MLGFVVTTTTTFAPCWRKISFFFRARSEPGWAVPADARRNQVSAKPWLAALTHLETARITATVKIFPTADSGRGSDVEDVPEYRTLLIGGYCRSGLVRVPARPLRTM